MTSQYEMTDQQTAKFAIGTRLRLIREEIYGRDGDRTLAKLLCLPHRTWLNYEQGVTVPGDVMLRYLTLTQVEPLWLLLGHGDKYRGAPEDPIESDCHSV